MKAPCGCVYVEYRGQLQLSARCATATELYELWQYKWVRECYTYLIEHDKEAREALNEG